MKSIFNTIEIGTLANAISSNLNLALRVNKCGNLDVKDKRSANNTIHYVFYKRGKGDYLIRRRTWVGNGRGINQHGGIMNGGKHFTSMRDMSNYFAEYIAKNEEKLYK